MKKIILHGSQYHSDLKKARKFLDIFIATGKEKILDCIWGRIDTDERLKIDSDFFLKMNPKISFKLNTGENFDNDIKTVDVIFVQGGNVKQIVDKMVAIKNFKDLCQGKIVIGVSGGASALCTIYGVGKTMRVGYGVGMVKLGVIPHFESKAEAFEDVDWGLLKKKMINQYPNLTIECINEGEFIEIDK